MAYSSHHHKEIFDVSQLDLQKVALAFGLTVPPNVSLNIRTSGKNSRRMPNEKKFFKIGIIQVRDIIGLDDSISDNSFLFNVECTSSKGEIFQIKSSLIKLNYLYLSD